MPVAEETIKETMSRMNNTQIIINVVILIVLLLTLMMAWASHRKLKTHQYYLQALIENEVLEDYAEAVATTQAAATTTPAATTPPLTASSALRRSQGEMCNDLRSPMGGKIYNRDCLTAASITGSGALKKSAAPFPNINTLIQKDYTKSG